MLRRAAREADERDLDRIPRALVESVVEEAALAVRDRHVATLGTHMRLLYEIVVEAGELAAGELHERYEQRASDQKTKR